MLKKLLEGKLSNKVSVLWVFGQGALTCTYLVESGMSRWVERLEAGTAAM